jgi:hypothetical protein
VSGFFRTTDKVSPPERVRDFARVQVRAGLLDDDALVREVAAAVEAELPDESAEATARALVTEARTTLLDEQAGWEVPTDHDRLQAAFDDLSQQDVVVLQAVEDHWVADATLRRLDAEGRPPQGAVWFTPPDVWHAVDHGMLELNVWHPDTANVALGEPLLDAVVDALAAHGLGGHFDEGRVEVAAHWRKPLPG